MADLFIALIHHPVLDRRGDIVTAAVTSLDIHDLARAARTYGVRAMYVVHPVAEQREFARTVIDHWRIGTGRKFDSRRKDALEIVEVMRDLDEAIAAATRDAGARPLLVYTSARSDGGRGVAEVRTMAERSDGPPLLILFGTGFGMAPEVQQRADIVMAPILGVGDYNHLSVRSAAAIILDRLRGR
ncbi:MAG: RNA methyltransferase [Candidatus Binataceae bacterium]